MKSLTSLDINEVAGRNEVFHTSPFTLQTSKVYLDNCIVEVKVKCIRETECISPIQFRNERTSGRNSTINKGVMDQTRRKPSIGQATKGVRWMPWRREPMKDVASYEKPRGAASRL